MPEDALQPLELDDEERELVQLELKALLPALKGERRRRGEALDEALGAGHVPGDLVPLLASVVELSLQTARARQLYRAEGERVLTAVFRRTPRGRELAEHLHSVNQALRAVAGHTVTSARVGMRTVGHFTVTIETDAATITLAIRSDGLNVESVAVGAG